MRHALLRLCDRLGMDVHWYVMRRRMVLLLFTLYSSYSALILLPRGSCFWCRRYVTTPSPEVFSITKRKFHNVLQGVAPGKTIERAREHH